jgi:hypothetical protein
MFLVGEGNVVGVLVGSCMRAKAPAAGSGKEPLSIVAKWHCKGGGVVVGCRGWLSSRGALASGTWEYGFMLGVWFYVTPCCYHP